MPHELSLGSAVFVQADPGGNLTASSGRGCMFFEVQGVKHMQVLSFDVVKAPDNDG